MRYILFILFTLICNNAICKEQSLKDSLIEHLAKNITTQERVKTYRNLADISFSTPDERFYLKELYKNAEQANMQEEMLGALSDLSMAYMDKELTDSAEYYKKLVIKLAPPETSDRWMSYISMFEFNTLIFSNNNKIAIDAINQKLELYKSNSGKKDNNIYKQIEEAYIIGDAYYQQKKYNEAIPHMTTAADLSSQLPLNDGYYYKYRTMRWLALVCARAKQNNKAIEILEHLINLQKEYYDKHLKDKRPYYPMDDYYVLNYTSLLTNLLHLPKRKIDLYMSKITEL